MKIKLITFLILLLYTANAFTMPKINVKHQRNRENFAEVQVSNLTMEKLICHVAIDGYKLPFKLKAMEISKWYTATDIRFNHTNFSVWCDYLKLYPQYQ